MYKYTLTFTSETSLDDFTLDDRLLEIGSLVADGKRESTTLQNNDPCKKDGEWKLVEEKS